jgi:hypothetical protein
MALPAFIQLLLIFAFWRSAVPALAKDGDSERRPQSQYFDRQREFPNYFLPERLRSLSLEQIPELEIARSQALIEAALNSVFERMTVPIQRTAGGKIEPVRILSYLQAEVDLIDRGAHVIPSGGVVRSGVGFLYHEIRKGVAKGVAPETTLGNITRATNDIPGHRIRGVASDFDLLLLSAAKQQSQIIDRLAKVLNSAESATGMQHSEGGGLKRSLFTIADVKDYEKQTTRAAKQGGSTLDLLAFNPVTGKFVEPRAVPGMNEGNPGIVRNFIMGHFAYVAPENKKDIEDAPKQTIRGLRPLVELPFLGVFDERVLRSEIEELIARVERGEVLSKKALEQFDKLVRNARYGGGHNRIFRGHPDSIEALALRLAKLTQTKFKRMTIPEYGDYLPIEHRVENSRGLNGFPADLLMPQDEFVRNHTDNGYLYHGTPSIEAALAIIRGGLFVSDGQQIVNSGKGARIVTMGAMGRGVYMSPWKEVARSYASETGMVFKMRIKAEARLNVIDWVRAARDPRIKPYLEKAKGLDMDIFRYLAHHHGIDNFVNHHSVMQNLSIVEIPNSIEAVLHSYVESLQIKRDRSLNDRVEAFEIYANLWRSSRALGTGNFPDPIASQDEIMTDGLLLLKENNQALLTEFSFGPVFKFFSHRREFQEALKQLFISIERPTERSTEVQIWDIYMQALKQENLHSMLLKILSERLKRANDAASAWFPLKAIEYFLRSKPFPKSRELAKDLIQFALRIKDKRSQLEAIRLAASLSKEHDLETLRELSSLLRRDGGRAQFFNDVVPILEASGQRDPVIAKNIGPFVAALPRLLKLIPADQVAQFVDLDVLSRIATSPERHANDGVAEARYAIKNAQFANHEELQKAMRRARNSAPLGKELWLTAISRHAESREDPKVTTFLRSYLKLGSPTEKIIAANGLKTAALRDPAIISDALSVLEDPDVQVEKFGRLHFNIAKTISEWTPDKSASVPLIKVMLKDPTGYLFHHLPAPNIDFHREDVRRVLERALADAVHDQAGTERTERLIWLLVREKITDPSFLLHLERFKTGPAGRVATSALMELRGSDNAYMKQVLAAALTGGTEKRVAFLQSLKAEQLATPAVENALIELWKSGDGRVQAAVANAMWIGSGKLSRRLRLLAVEFMGHPESLDYFCTRIFKGQSDPVIVRAILDKYYSGNQAANQIASFVLDYLKMPPGVSKRLWNEFFDIRNYSKREQNLALLRTEVDRVARAHVRCRNLLNP